MSRFFLFILIIIWNLSLIGQDIINLKDGNEIYAKVLKITDYEVEYRKFSNLEGPIYTKKTTEIESIRYEKGQVDRFSKSADNSIKSTPIYPKISPPANDGTRIAKVKKMNSVDVYFMSTPLSEYEIINYSGNQFSDFQMKNIFSYGSRSSISSRMSFITIEALKLAKSENIIIDGVIYNEGNSVLMIRYTDTFSDQRLAVVDTSKGLETYIFSEPYDKKYDIIQSTTFQSGSLTSVFSLGVIDASLRDNIDVLVNYISQTRKKVKPLGVLYLSGDEGHGIKW